MVAGATAFFAGNFLGIVGLGLYGAFKHTMPDFSLAYRRGGAPISIAVFCVAFVVIFVREMRTVMHREP